MRRHKKKMKVQDGNDKGEPKDVKHSKQKALTVKCWQAFSSPTSLNISEKKRIKNIV